ncbi:MAG TPA: glycosyltransferase family 39 protein [Planctomycetota bacterium]|nr:glycosyltransferase family 39 protein [Planctomycetota bacterium]
MTSVLDASGRMSDGGRWLPGLILVISAAAALRVAALVASPAELPDAVTYSHMAAGLLERGELADPDGNRARVMPGYPLFLAGCRAAFGGSHLAWRVPQALLGVATVLAVCLLARRLFGERAALAAGWLSALDPFLIGFGAQMLTEGLSLCLLAWAALLAWRSRGASVGGGDDSGSGGRRTGGPLWSAAGAGLVVALVALVRPAGALIGIVLVLGALLLPGAGRPRPRNALGRAALAMAVCLAALSPWWVRNGRVLGHFVPLSTDGGQSLYEANSPSATGGPAIPETVGVRLRGAPPMGELERDRLLGGEARAWIAENPGRFARLAAVKLARTWSPLPNFHDYRSWRYALPSLLAWLAVMGLAGFGAWRGCRCRPFDRLTARALSAVEGVSDVSTAPAVGGSPLTPDTRNLKTAVLFCVLPVLFVAAAHMIWIGSVRYRMPAWIFLEVLAGAGAAWLWERLSRRWRNTEAATAGSPDQSAASSRSPSVSSRTP